MNEVLCSGSKKRLSLISFRLRIIHVFLINANCVILEHEYPTHSVTAGTFPNNTAPKKATWPPVVTHRPSCLNASKLDFAVSCCRPRRVNCLILRSIQLRYINVSLKGRKLSSKQTCINKHVATRTIETTYEQNLCFHIQTRARDSCYDFIYIFFVACNQRRKMASAVGYPLLSLINYIISMFN